MPETRAPAEFYVTLYIHCGQLILRKVSKIVATGRRNLSEKIVPWGTDGRLPLSDLDVDLGSGHTAYHRASLIDLYLRTKFH